jgi:hypothetical protein
MSLVYGPIKINPDSDKQREEMDKKFRLKAKKHPVGRANWVGKTVTFTTIKPFEGR